MNLTWTILIGLVASIIGGAVSGLFVMRKVTHDAKRLYARQMRDDFYTMATLVFFSARDYLKSLGYEVEGLEAFEPGTKLKENLAMVGRVRDECQKYPQRKLEAYETGKLVSEADDLVKYALDETPGLRNFLSRYLLQSTYFDGLCEALSFSELLKFWHDHIEHSVNDAQIRISITSIAVYLLDMLVGLLKAGAEINYYSNAKAWTWRLFLPIRQKGGTVMSNESKDTKIKGRWWSGLWSQLLVGLGQIFFGVVLSGMVFYLVAQYKIGSFQPFELATVVGLIGGFPLVAAFGGKTEEAMSKRLKTIGGLYLFAAICLVVFGFYQAADQAELVPSAGLGGGIFKIIYVGTFYGGAITFIFGMWLTLLVVPELIGLGGVKERIRRIFGKRD